MCNKNVFDTEGVYGHPSEFDHTVINEIKLLTSISDRENALDSNLWAGNPECLIASIAEKQHVLELYYRKLNWLHCGVWS